MKNYFDFALDNPDYNVEDDFDTMHETRTCEQCHCSFTLDEAFSTFYEHIGISYRSAGYTGELCGDCAADDYNDSTPIMH